MNNEAKYTILGVIIAIFIFGLYYINNDKVTFFGTIIKDKGKDTQLKVDSIDINTQEQESINNETTTTKVNTTVKTYQPIKASREYYCLNDQYTLEGDKCISKIVGTTFKNYSCDEGELVGTQCWIDELGKGYTTKKIDAKIESYYCCCGYELVGEQCIYTSSYNAGIKYTCPDGYVLKGEYCYK